MNKRLAPSSTSCTVTVAPATVRQFAVDQGEFLIEHLESLVDSMVTGEMPRRHMLLVGPLASGKRALARAVAAEFGTRVHELDPSGSTREDDIDEILRRMRDGEILVVHNIDEFPPPGLVALCRAIVTGKVSDADSKYCDGAEAAEASRNRRAQPPIPTSRLAAFTIIATTNAPEAVAMSLHESMIRISVQRSASGTKAAILRSARARSITCTEEALELLARVVMAAADDIFEEMMSFAIAHCRRCGVDLIDGERARQIAASTWSLMPNNRAVESVRKAAEAELVTVEDMCTQLCVPPSIARDLRGKREKPKPAKRLAEALEAALEEEDE